MIEGNRVRLRAAERTDLPKFQDRLNDSKVTADLAHLLPLSIEDEERSFDALAVEAPEQAPLAIELRVDHGWRLAGESRRVPRAADPPHCRVRDHDRRENPVRQSIMEVRRRN